MKSSNFSNVYINVQKEETCIGRQTAPKKTKRVPYAQMLPYASSSV